MFQVFMIFCTTGLLVSRVGWGRVEGGKEASLRGDASIQNYTEL
jgi:hypothetical protein